MWQGLGPVLKSSNPSANVTQILNSFETTGEPVTDPRNGFTFPRIQVDDAVSDLSPPPTPWYDSNWQLRKEITVDQTLVPSDLIDFPMLVSITDSDLASSAQADGDDILFTAGDGITKLSHEIEKWDDGTGELAAWVKVPNLSSVSNTKLFMYYDNPTVSNQQDTTGGTWRAEYKTVYHLQDDFNDSTSNGNHCTATGTTNAAGAIADSQEFDGIDDILNCHSDPSIDDVWTSGGTMSVWLNPDTAGGQNKGIVFQKTVNSLRINGQSGDDVRLAFVARFDGSWEKWNTSNYPITLDNWHLLHLTYNSDSSSNNPEFCKCYCRTQHTSNSIRNS